jgi:hypothetical protein
MSTVIYNLKIDGDADELLNKLRHWIDERLIVGQVGGQSFTVKEIDKDVVKEINQSVDGKLAGTIEGMIENDRLKLSAEPTTQRVMSGNGGRVIILLIGILLATATQNLLYGVLIMIGAIIVIAIGNSSERRRIKNDLDVLVWMVNTRCNVRLTRQ